MWNYAKNHKKIVTSLSILTLTVGYFITKNHSEDSQTKTIKSRPGEIELTQKELDFSFLVEGNYALQKIQDNEKVFIGDQRVNTDLLYKISLDNFSVQGKKTLDFKGEKLFLVPITYNGTNFHFSTEDEAEILSHDTDFNYSLEKRLLEDNKLKSSELRFKIPGIIYNNKKFYRISNKTKGTNVNINGIEARALYVPVGYTTRLDFEKTREEDQYILGVIDINGKTYGLFPGQIKKKFENDLQEPKGGQIKVNKITEG